MADYKEVPISAAKQMAEEFDKDQVIVVTWDDAHQMCHVTTYGRSRKSSAQAAHGGNFVKQALGWPDQLCRDAPDWWINNIKELRNIVSMIDRIIVASSPPLPNLHPDRLKDALKDASTRIKAIYVEVSGVNPWK